MWSGIRCTAGAQDPGDVPVEDDRAVHLGQLAQAGGGERDVEGEAAGRDRLDDLVVAEHDQGAGAAAQDALEPVAQGGAGGDRGQRRAQAQRARPCGRCQPRSSRVADRRGVRRRAGVSLGSPRQTVCATGPPARVGRAGRRARAASVARAEVEHRSASMPVDDRRSRRPRRAGVAARLGRHDRRAGSRAARPRRGAAARSRTRRSSPARPISPIATTLAAAARRLRRPTRARRDREVAGRLGEPGAADGGDEDVVAVQRGCRQCCWSTARIIATRERVEPGRRTARPLGGAAGDQRLHLGEHRPAALHRHRDAGAGHRLSWCSTKSPVGSVTAAMPSAAEVEAADLVDRAEAVLHRADHPEPGVAVALEVEHDVDEVLEHARAGDRAVLGDVADDASW